MTALFLRLSSDDIFKLWHGMCISNRQQSGRCGYELVNRAGGQNCCVTFDFRPQERGGDIVHCRVEQIRCHLI